MSADDEVEGLLAGTSKTMAGARSCWLVTSTGDGGVDARPMGRLQGDPGDDAWLIRFITDARSRKAAEIKRAAKVAVIFDVPADDAYVTVTGRAAVKDSAADVRRLWKAAYDGFFPTDFRRDRRRAPRALDPRRDTRAVRGADDGAGAGRRRPLAGRFGPDLMR
jgi:general stress protein 26